MGISNKLFLWDIDGTLISVGGAGERALIHAIKAVFKIDGDLKGVDYAGRTDRRIAHMLHDHFDFPRSDASMALFLESYLHHLELEMKHTRMHVLPGVQALLDAIAASPDCHQGLLTGNLRQGARIKLDHFKLWHYFAFGAFSDLSMDRNALAPHALIEARNHTDLSFDPACVFVIGDTPHDIECGKVIGARTIAVSTGRFTPDQLSEHAPDYTFTQLPSPEDFFAVVK